MASDLAVLILIPAASYLTANHPRTSWLEGANKTTSSAKSRDEIQWLPNQILSIKIMNRIGNKGQPCWSPTCSGTGLTYCRQCKPGSCSSRTGTTQPLAEGLWPHTTKAPPTECHEGHGQMPSPSPQSTRGLVGQTPMNPRAPCRGYRAGPVFHGQDENRIVPPKSEIRLSPPWTAPLPRWRG